MVTHIIASTLPPKKADEWRRLRVVKPAWVVDSIAAGRLLPWSDYRLINEGPGQKRIQFDGGKLAVQDGKPDQMAGYREQSKGSYYADQVQTLAAAHDRVGATTSSIFQQLETTVVGENDTSRDDEFDFPDLDMGSDPFSSLEKSGKADRTGDIVNRTGEAADDNNNPDVNYANEEVDVEDTYAKKPYQDLPAGQRLHYEDNDENDNKEEDEEDEEDVADFEEKSPSDPPQDFRQQERKPLTSEEHNALLLSDPKFRKASTANPDFLKQFYSESRLHHLSTWKAELKSKMQRLAAEKGRQAAATTKKGNKKRQSDAARRYVMHVDFDSFFCAVSLKSAPEYVDKPAVVAHSTGNASEIASCNYTARKFGVKNGMWMRGALKLCPDLKVLPYDFPAYEEASRLFYETILDIGDGSVVQSVSVDEALVDITGIVLEGGGASEDSISREQDKANRLATMLRQQIKDKTGCDVSVGIGGNILLAKVALRRAKPAGQFQIRPEDVLDVLGELKVEQLPGVAYSIGGKLDEIGVKLVQDLRGISRERLVAVLGPKTGERLYEYARGVDYAAVGDQSVRKSVSAEVNWGIRFVNQEEVDEFVLNLCRELERRLLNEQVRGRALTMKIMRRAADAPLDPAKHLGHGKCDVFSKSVVFGVATHDAERIGKEALSILRSFHFTPGDFRGLGVQLQKLEPIKAGSGGSSSNNNDNNTSSAMVAADSSQKKLSFGSVPPGTARASTRVVQTAVEKHKPLRKSVFTTPITVPINTPTDKMDGAKAREGAAPPLAFASTQFFMPANPDPSVLAELPPDIIRRLVGQSREAESHRSGNGGSGSSSSSRNLSPMKRESRAQSPTSVFAVVDELPPDIDPEVFEALPADMRAELLAEYKRNARQQSNSPAPSPHRATKTKSVSATGSGGSKKAAGGGGGHHSPVKRGLWGTRGLAAVAAARERRHDAEANRVQTSIFVPLTAAAEPEEDSSNSIGNDGLEEFDPEVLAALPDDVREEVLEDFRQRRQTLQAQQALLQQAQQALRLEMPVNRGRTGGPPAVGPGLGTSAAVQQQYAGAATASERRGPPQQQQQQQRPMLHFPAPPPKMSFRTSSSSDVQEPPLLLSLAETKAMIKTWHGATREEGPHETDVEVLERYLAGVITQELDMEKARKMVVWLEWLVEDGADEEERGEGGDGGGGGLGKQSWQFALARVKEAVQAAMRSRGLGPLQFV